MHGADTREQQRFAGGGKRGAGSNHIVDEQHREMTTAGARTERRAVQPLRPRMTGLREPMAAVQQTPARHTQLGRDGPGQQLGLVVPTRPSAAPAGGRPCHDVDLAQPHATNHQPRQLPRDETPIAVLEPVDDLTSNALERQGCHDTGLADLGRRAGERETTAVAQRGARLITAGAKGSEDHGAICTRRV